MLKILLCSQVINGSGPRGVLLWLVPGQHVRPVLLPSMDPSSGLWRLLGLHRYTPHDAPSNVPIPLSHPCLVVFGCLATFHDCRGDLARLLGMKLVGLVSVLRALDRELLVTPKLGRVFHISAAGMSRFDKRYKVRGGLEGGNRNMSKRPLT